MIKIVKAEYARDYRVDLTFSDGARGTYDAAALVTRATVLTRPLQDKARFREFFLELGALCWKNGLELSPAALYAELAAQGVLQRPIETA